jgi:hypothetical protein
MKFDSLKKIREQYNFKRKCHIFYPDKKFRIFWDVIHSIILLLTCVLTPFNVAFMDNEELKSSLYYGFVNEFIDYFFLVDILVNCNTALIIEEKSLVIDNRCKIFISYLKSWLIIDIMSILPFETIIGFFNDETAEDENAVGNINQFVRITRISRLYKLAKITKLIRIFKLMKSRKKISERINQVVKHGAAIDRLLFFILILLLCSHGVGCMWIYLAETFRDEDDNSNWIDASGFGGESTSIMDLYAAATYFTMQTFTTVGYGDIVVSNIPERLVAILL